MNDKTAYGILELSDKKGHENDTVIAQDSTLLKSKMLFPDRHTKKYPPGTIVKYEITIDKGNYAFVKTIPIRTASVNKILDYLMKIGYFRYHDSDDIEIYQDDYHNFLVRTQSDLMHTIINGKNEEFYCHQSRTIDEYPKWKNVTINYKAKIDSLHRKYNEVAIRPLCIKTEDIDNTQKEFLKDMINAYSILYPAYYQRPFVFVSDNGIFKFVRYSYQHGEISNSEISYVGYHVHRKEWIEIDNDVIIDSNIKFVNVSDLFIETFKKYHISTRTRGFGDNKEEAKFENESITVYTIDAEKFTGDFDEKVEKSWKEFEETKTHWKKYVNQNNAREFLKLSEENLLGLDGWLDKN